MIEKIVFFTLKGDAVQVEHDFIRLIENSTAGKIPRFAESKRKKPLAIMWIFINFIVASQLETKIIANN